MFFSLVDWLGTTWGLLCVGIIPILIGFFGVVELIKFFDKRTWLMIILGIVWCVILIYSVGGLVKNSIFIPVIILYIITVMCGILFFEGCNAFGELIKRYVLCCIANLFLLGFPFSIGQKNLYNLLLNRYGNTKQVSGWGTKQMLMNNESCLELANCLKLKATDPLYRGLIDFCLENRHEAAHFFTKARDDKKHQTESVRNSLLNGAINYCEETEETFAKSVIFFNMADKEMGAMASLILETRDIELKEKLEKRLFLTLFEKIEKQPGLIDKKERNEVGFILFMSLLWGQIITVPMIIYRK